MASEIILPRVDMDMATGRVALWHAEDGAAVEKGQALFEIETDKAAMEIEAPESGVLHIADARTGIDMPVGSVLGWITAAGEAPPRPAAPAAEPDAVAPEAAVPEDAAHETILREPAFAEAEPAEEARPRATPQARRLAETLGLQLTDISGSGPRGRVQAQDVQEAAGAAAAPALPAALSRPAADGAPLHHVWLRRGQGVPSLLIHGFGAELASWRPLLAAGGETGPVLAIDLPGHGRSPLAGGAGLEDLVDAVEATLQSLGLDAVHLVAHSLGGAVATALAARGSVAVRSLLLLAPAGLGPAMHAEFVQGFLRAGSTASLQPWLNLLVADATLLPGGLAAATLRQRQENPAMLEAQRRIAATLLPDGVQAIDTRALFGTLPMPVKLVLGQEDRILPWRQAMGLPGHVALHIFAGTGHMPQLERRQEVARLWAELRCAGN
ncbi:acetoin dehydrogenase dihydrolipoyllysine-residue acetyltransferase subunit [Pseudoroseomonas cervicalis]|uniref:acetoin dehydrogenase dihydrolipoyllysine-residue acetyltransferase subunit n=1 Tax=Teichococcus cervicalis TaxID=204525 RepID=UPI0022F19626|nr:acetoin dehydrogenase dihydrolipoyllysine-residue acetyltransferase subunit [Pseudoroseomonas cervicalis]WBV45311.1 acetoin dehydrogenase dihydrolipoyllysine-residue acetyltransferase subunit [Pseudoroseomonas cervicalis]